MFKFSKSNNKRHINKVKMGIFYIKTRIYFIIPKIILFIKKYNILFYIKNRLNLY